MSDKKNQHEHEPKGHPCEEDPVEGTPETSSTDDPTEPDPNEDEGTTPPTKPPTGG